MMSDTMDEHILTAFGQHIKKLRVNKKLSQEQLGLISNLDRTYISGIERGKRNVSLLNIVKLASSLDVSLNEIINFHISDKPL